MNKRNRVIALITSIFMFMIFVGCSNQVGQYTDHLDVTNTANISRETGGNTEAPSHYDDSVGADTTTVNKDIKPINTRKIIKTAILDIETLEFDETVSILTEKAARFGGYVEQSRTTGVRLHETNNGRSASMVLRIPSSRFMEFLNVIEDTGNMIHKEIGGEDVTYEYFDTEARLKSLKVQEDRLLSLLSKSEKLEEIIEVERELSHIRYQVETLTGTLKKYDDLIDYSTLTVRVIEVPKYKELKPMAVSLKERIKESFIDSIKSIKNIGEEIIIFIVSAIPFFVIIFLLGLLLRPIIKAIKERQNRKKNDNKN